MSDDRPTAVEFEQAIDPSTLLPGEEPSSPLIEDAIHWIRVYGELIAVKGSLLDRADQAVQGMTDDADRDIEFDRRLLRAQAHRYRFRYEHWLGRAAKLGGANSHARVSTRPSLHIERGPDTNREAGADDGEARCEAFEQLFESEPDQPSRSEVTGWVDLYSELTALLQRQLDETLQFAEGRPQAMRECLARENVKILGEELGAFQGRLALWRERAGAPGPSSQDSSF